LKISLERLEHEAENTGFRPEILEKVFIDWKEFQNMLLPMLRKKHITQIKDVRAWGKNILQECHAALDCLLPLRNNEIEFMNYLLDHGEIKPELICRDKELANKIALQPGLKWKALNVKKFKSKN
jgi:hypothetical protein